MTYSLSREKDRAGDAGQMSLGLWRDDKAEFQQEHNCRPRVGIAMRVGSLSARTFSAQDWWQTTVITEILEESENRVRFKTGNSIYIWEKF